MRFIEKLDMLLAGIRDAIIPPRSTEKRVQALTTEALYEIIRRQKNPVYAPPIRTLLPYLNPAIRALIYELKYRQNPHAIALAAGLLHEELLGLSEDTLSIPLLIPVPMHPLRRRIRGYNQTELLCERIAAMQGVSVAYNESALARVRGGTPQQKLKRTQRLAHMQGAMQADPAIVRGRICIVIDDVSTTGATLTECRRALLGAKARAVHLIALAG